MRSRGYTDKQIEYTILYFSAEDIGEIGEDGTRFSSYATYYPTPGHSIFYLYEAVRLFRERTARLTDPEEIEAIRRQVSDELSVEFSQAVRHELKHQMNHPGLGLHPDDINDLLNLPYEPRGWTTASHDTYDQEPEEVEVRELVEKDSNDIVRLQIKPPGDNPPKTQEL